MGARQPRVFAKFDGYVPRGEAPDGAAGGKRVLVEREAWHIIPDPAIAPAALPTGEVDWYEQPAFDLLPTLARSRDIRIQISDPIGSLAMIRFNHLHPPFDKPAVRRAVMMAMNQTDYLAAITGNPQYATLCAASSSAARRSARTRARRRCRPISRPRAER